MSSPIAESTGKAVGTLTEGIGALLTIIATLAAIAGVSIVAGLGTIIYLLWNYVL
ncbi:hypothetical protein VPHD148_0173 [Vibrio phage D148]